MASTRVRVPPYVPPSEPRRPDLFNEETLALVMALKVTTGRMLAALAQSATDPQECLRRERALMEEALRPAVGDDFSKDILTRVRDRLDALFSDAAGLLPK